MNKGVKETKSDPKRIRNVSKIATRVISENRRSPTRDKNRSLSMNSLVANERVESPQKLIPREIKPRIITGNLMRNKVVDSQKSEGSGNSVLKDKETPRSSEMKTETTAQESGNRLNRKSKLEKKLEYFEELIAKEGSIEKLLHIKETAKTVYNVDDMSPIQIRDSISRVDDKTAKPFSFLNNIIDHPDRQETKMTRGTKDQELNPTDIDVQLSSLVKRVELNRTLLERANQRIKEINFLTERNRMISLRDMNYDEDSFLKLKDAGDGSKQSIPGSAELKASSHPALEELQKTMSSTIEMLGYVHKMSCGDLASGDIPPELTEYLSTPIIAKKDIIEL